MRMSRARRGSSAVSGGVRLAGERAACDAATGDGVAADGEPLAGAASAGDKSSACGEPLMPICGEAALAGVAAAPSSPSDAAGLPDAARRSSNGACVVADAGVCAADSMHVSASDGLPNAPAGGVALVSRSCAASPLPHCCGLSVVVSQALPRSMLRGVSAARGEAPA
jgi:hypothetical protein